ncbi:MAG: Blue-light-activated protein [Verrucomicrobiales bacterium]|nr:Blue-light-activated protein [Verrucomicrobiales bacterium]
MNTLNIACNRRVLVIDDNHAIHDDFRKILISSGEDTGFDTISAELFGEAPRTAAVAPFEIDSAFQGKEGLERVIHSLKDGRPYSMAFVDVRMPPGWDGIETIAKIWEVYPDLQIVICTAYSDYSWDDMIAKVGQSDRLLILKKPFDNVEVLQLANALTEKWRLLQESKLKIEDLEHLVQVRGAELHQTEERFRKLCNFLPLGIFEADADGGCHYTNPQWSTITGRSYEESKGDGWSEAIHPEDREATLKFWKQTAVNGQSWSHEYRVLNRQGQLRWVNATGNPILSETGEIAGYVGTVQDISDRKRLHNEREMMEVQLRHAQKLEAIGQLAAGIAHEINTPTQYIGDNTRFLKEAFADLGRLLEQYDTLFTACHEHPLNPELLARVQAAREQTDVTYLDTEIPKAIAQSLDGIERVSKIVKSMKEFSHPGTDQKTAVDLNHSIESTLTVAHNEWKYLAEMKTDFDPALPAVPCLPGEINQVILNLIINATHAIADVVGDGSKGKGTITIQTKNDGQWVEIRIGDTGAGIPEKIRSRIFEPFFTTKGVGKGTGQGLAIAHSVVVDKHQGSIHFETDLGKGTTFVIRLPQTEVVSQLERIAA